MYSAEHKTSSHIIIIINIPLIIILLYWVGLPTVLATFMVLSKCFFHSLIFFFPFILFIFRVRNNP